VLVSVGRLEANKGFADLAEALAHGALTAGWRWVLVGDGPERRSLQALVDRLRIADRVRLVGPGR
jgi:glycosyltransferase involved in cell wall biosynthesis